MRNAFARAWALYRKNAGSLLLFMLIEVLLRLIVLAPCLALKTGEYPWLAFLTIPLFILIVLPARRNAADALLVTEDGGSPVTPRLIEGLGVNVRGGLSSAWRILLWALPLIAATALAYIMYQGRFFSVEIDAFTVVRGIMGIGGGSAITGVKRCLMIYAATFVPLLLGLALHSGDRHARAMGEAPGALLKGQRGRLVLVWMLGLVTLLPFIAAAAWIGSDFIAALRTAFEAFGKTGSLSLPAVDSRVWLILGAFAGLLLPLVPLKSLITACFTHDLKKGRGQQT